jgi:hypothetical protein
MPGAPEWVRQVAAVTLVEGGDRRGARRVLLELISADESYIRAAAERSLAQLQALDTIENLAEVIGRYVRANDALPATWADLIRQRYLPGVPLDPTGRPFSYDPATGRVSIGTQSSLLPLPRGLGTR